MCGIALVASGFTIDRSSLRSQFGENGCVIGHEGKEGNVMQGSCLKPNDPELLVENLKTYMKRRGPDHLGEKKVLLQLHVENQPLHDSSNVSHGKEKCNGALSHPFYRNQEDPLDYDPNFQQQMCLHFIGATLQLRGILPLHQPLMDISGNLLVYNGEIFGGIDVRSDENDAETLMRHLERCCSCSCSRKQCFHVEKGEMSVPELLSRIEGPWALIYWQEKSKQLWFGRDAFGRRSLVVHWPTSDDFCFLLASVAPPLWFRKNSDAEIQSDIQLGAFEAENGIISCGYWEELPCGVYSIPLDASNHVRNHPSQIFSSEIQKHEWTDPLLLELVRWERKCVDPDMEACAYHDVPGVKGHDQKDALCSSGLNAIQPDLDILHKCPNQKIEDSSYFLLEKGIAHSRTSLSPSYRVLMALKESVKRRTEASTIFQMISNENRKVVAPMALLFSGGLDSMILAALLNECLDPQYKIDLLNVSFDGQLAPDRVSAKAGLRELQRVAPLRRWCLVEIDADLSDLASETKHVRSLICPANTYMDLNIGMALWLASSGDGWVHEDGETLEAGSRHFKYKSQAKILLVGSGADEQCAGYGRHRTKYRSGRWKALEEEMRLDVQRIWKRNLGRDDRCISDCGKEARFPFLDETVIKTLLEIPLWEIADLNQPVGRGDKKILREVAQLLRLEETATLPKRAIQFGSRIARESNRKNFGSNRAANQASAGSVALHQSS